MPAWLLLIHKPTDCFIENIQFLIPDQNFPDPNGVKIAEILGYFINLYLTLRLRILADFTNKWSAI